MQILGRNWGEGGGRKEEEDFHPSSLSSRVLKVHSFSRRCGFRSQTNEWCCSLLLPFFLLLEKLVKQSVLLLLLLPGKKGEKRE